MARDESGDFALVNFTYGLDKDDLERWHRSSQYQRWQFSEQELIEKRRALNEESTKMFPSDCQPLTVADEDCLLKYWLKKICDICTDLDLCEDISASACSFFKRFYLANPLVKHDHAAVIDTCIFLAAKTEHRQIPIDTFVNLIPNCSTAETLRKHEMVIGSSIDFQFSIWHPHTQLKTIWEDLSILRALSPVRPPLASHVLETAQQFLRVSRMTDFEFIFHPVVIALASLWLSGTMGKELVNEWVDMKKLGCHELDEVKRAAYRINGASGTVFQDNLEHLLDLFKSCQRYRRSKEKETRKRRHIKSHESALIKAPRKKTTFPEGAARSEIDTRMATADIPKGDSEGQLFSEEGSLIGSYREKRPSRSPSPSNSYQSEKFS
ncbi:hypothetical protein PIIN_01582 [Serendipita indica DSM 11827]|uniref:Cyclin-like domain-containing protein n=1 Tax=Serendipita indica (strain DSM 11827) TaxID=1109443 RepID=G4T8V6_SERID|nr:hypothetical protein PIIN_01582 [Serendipita indica DSM 11827]